MDVVLHFNSWLLESWDRNLGCGPFHPEEAVIEDRDVEGSNVAIACVHGYEAF